MEDVLRDVRSYPHCFGASFSHAGPHRCGSCGGCDCCVSSSWQQWPGFLFLLCVKRMKQPDPPLPLWVRSKTSPVAFQQNLQGFFFGFILCLFHVLPVSPSPSVASWVKASSVIDWGSRGNLNRLRLQSHPAGRTPGGRCQHTQQIKIISIESGRRDWM